MKNKITKTSLETPANSLSHKKSLSVPKDFRCMKCGKMLAKNNSVAGAEVKCVRCGTLNRILEHMIEQVIITSPEGKILFINHAVEMATGYSLHEAVGRKPSELWGGHMSTKFYAAMWKKMLKDKGSIKLKMTNKTKSGKLYEVELLVSPILDTAGDILFFAGIEIVI